MSGHNISFTTPPVSLTAATAKTCLQLLAAAGQVVELVGWEIDFDGTSPTAQPVYFRVLRQSGLGTMSSLTGYNLREEVVLSAVTSGHHTATVEPSASNVLHTGYIHPQSGRVFFYAPGSVSFADSGRIGWEITAPATVDVVITAFIKE